MTKKLVVLVLLLAGTLFSSAQTNKYNKLITGRWLNEEKDAIIKIYEVKGKIFGKIVWLKNPLRNGKPKLDDNNPEKKLQSRPIKGLIILKDFVYDEDMEWGDGTIYDPKSGNTYSSYITRKDKNTLDIRGYIGISLFGRTTTWTRAPKPKQKK